MAEQKAEAVLSDTDKTDGDDPQAQDEGNPDRAVSEDTSI